MSEFGSGIVVPLVRVAEHFHDNNGKRVVSALAWKELDPIIKETLVKAVFDGEPSPWAAIVARTADTDIEVVIHEAIEAWCYAAFDHLFELDQKKTPPKLKRFKDMLESMRFGTRAIIYTGDDWAQINRVFREATLEVDRSLLGVEADWGDM